MAYSINSLKPRSGGSQEIETLKDPRITNLKTDGATGSLVTRTSIEFAALPPPLTVKTTAYLRDPGSRELEQRRDASGALKKIDVGGIRTKHSES